MSFDSSLAASGRFWFSNAKRAAARFRPAMSSALRLVDSVQTNSAPATTRIATIHETSLLCPLAHALSRSPIGGRCAPGTVVVATPLVFGVDFPEMRVAVAMLKNVQCSVFTDQ